MSTINAESINCNNFITNNNNYNNNIVKVGKVTFNNTSSSDNFLKNAGFFQLRWPANYFLLYVLVHFSKTDIVMSSGMEGDDKTLINIADDQGNALVGSATNITIGSAPGAAGVVVANNNNDRVIGGLKDTLGSRNGSDVSREDRVFTGVIYHDSQEDNDGNGDGATHTSGLDTAVIYLQFAGIKVPN